MVLIGVLVFVKVLLAFLVFCDFVVLVVVIDGVGVGAFAGVGFVVFVSAAGVVVVGAGLVVVVVARVGAPTDSFLTTCCGVCVSCGRGLL